MTSTLSRIVIFGATGNVGTSLIRRVLTDHPGTSITAVARRIPAHPDGTSGLDRLDFVARDVGVDLVDDVVAGADAVVHLAWQLQPSHDRDQLWRTNVHGSRRVFAAAAAAKVRRLVFASSVGVYAPGPKTTPVDETWSRAGVPTSTYSRHKAEVERHLDVYEQAHPDIGVVRMRPGLIFKKEAAASIHRLFIGRIPRTWLPRLPFVPDPAPSSVQVVHSDDVARAFTRALTTEATGAFNICADPPVDAAGLARMLDAAHAVVPAGPIRWAWHTGWMMRVAAAEPGWLDLALRAPLLSTLRARQVLDWEARVPPDQAIRELLAGFAEKSAGSTPALADTGWKVRSA